MASGFQIALLLCLASGLLTAESCCEEKKPCCAACPPGWTQFGDRCFMFHIRGKAWHEAERDCLSMDGNLASVHSVKEHDFLRDYVYRVSYSYRYIWLGGHDAVKEGFWMWADGSKFNYTRWATGVPNNLKKEDCLEMNYAGTYWNDRKCTAIRSYVCSKDLPCCDRNH
ncbi:galactose-specific lectin nattectin-like [Sebastes umbrosus]|uniref:galactose-specific lectin nattectin-like n=1 Tax=Sebastes umbrosus TaxID=72105 RepID=UPI00189CA08B|nr:galactose-specific lectin nattectin-like [Sebastes umbrosus]